MYSEACLLNNYRLFNYVLTENYVKRYLRLLNVHIFLMRAISVCMAKANILIMTITADLVTRG